MSATSSSRVVAAERRRKALGLRRAGASYEQIAEALGVTKQRAHAYVKEALKSIERETKETAEEVKTLELARLDELLTLLWPKLRDASITEDQKMKVFDRVLKAMERRSKLLGLDAPQRHQHEGKVDLEAIPREEIDRLEEMWKANVIEGEGHEIPDVELIGDGQEV